MRIDFTPEFLEVFWSRVDKSGECWVWTGYKSGSGYGRIVYRHERFMAHRLSYALKYGDPGELFCCHKCDNPPCVNPDQIFLGTVLDNGRDAAAKGRMPSGDRNYTHQHPEITRGENNGRAVLSQLQAQQIIGLLKNHASTIALAKQFNVSKGAITNIKRGMGWNCAERKLECRPMSKYIAVRSVSRDKRNRTHISFVDYGIDGWTLCNKPAQGWASLGDPREQPQKELCQTCLRLSPLGRGPIYRAG